MLITETHLEGDFERILPKGQLLIHHGPRVQPSLGAKGGVAVILSEDLATEWRKGKCKMSKGGEIAGATRFMSISIKLKIVNSRKLSINKKTNYHTLTLIPCYFPHSGYKEEELDSFVEKFSLFYSSAAPNKNASTIIGADINASIGNRNSGEVHLNPSPDGIEKDGRYEEEIDSIHNLLGPHGNPYRNACGERVLNLMRELDLRAPSTFFDSHGKFNTWRCPKRRPFQIDHFLTPRTQLCRTLNVQRKFDGVDSDHAALLMNFELDCTTLLSNKLNREKEKLPKKKIDNHILRTDGKSTFQEKISSYLDSLDPPATQELSMQELFQNFEKHIVESATEVAEREVTHRPDWFSESESILLNLIDKRNDALKCNMKRGVVRLQPKQT